MIQSIEKKMKLTLVVALGSFVTSIIIVMLTFFFWSKERSQERREIYILNSDAVAMRATLTSLDKNRSAEYREHIEKFHTTFFSLTPDNTYMDAQMKKAMYLVDESGVAQYNNLKEQGFFNSILSSSSVLTLTTDSIVLDQNDKHFKFYGRQKIERQSSIVIRTLITEGYLKDLPTRTEHNGHAVLIQGWKTIENKDISHDKKNTF